MPPKLPAIAPPSRVLKPRPTDSRTAVEPVPTPCRATRAAAEVAAAAVPADPESAREAVCAALRAQRFLEHDDPLFMHGRGFVGEATPPKVLWASKQPPRDDHDCESWLTATEFQDDCRVADQKARQLAELIRLSRKTVLYTGAGISASAVGQAARSGTNKEGWEQVNKMAVKPTPTHHALGILGREGLIHSWVQQNHDGLPQKAGFPQGRINEIHGSWYDPSNPVVKYSGSLHERAYPWMKEDAETADLVLVLGTSLGGLNADQVATKCAERSCVGRSLGTAMINLQQTLQDGKMTLRSFGKSDDFLRLLLHHLGIGMPRVPKQIQFEKKTRVLVPYDGDGRRCEDRKMWLDLSDGQAIRLTPGHNIQGAGQPQYMHIGANSPITIKGVRVEPSDGTGRIRERRDHEGSFILFVGGATMRLGVWWLDSAVRGEVDQLPVVNLHPAFE